ncbi:hypothetical protein E9934_12060 [Nocardioides caeni]|uniref:Uncharacterized protein n=1 Tax=Nocardioides caeni TaxID=574700 RepID=A0A4S8N7A2_9ACTN|nr:hypothetical protein [Nocardioides caeni]THV12088.1 hypothetical protein E9934_12060 [Nocardioides caeni]
MSEQSLRDLLRDRAAEVEEADLAGAAWARARRTRQRRVTAVASAAVVAVVASGAAVVATGGGDGPGPTSPTPQTTTPPVPTATAGTGPVPHAVRAGRQHGAEIWWAPEKSAEVALPVRDVDGVPETIDLSAGAPPHRPGMTATAAFTVLAEDGQERVVLLGSDASTYSLDTSRLDPVADEGGNRFVSLGDQGLAPDGRHVFFRQVSSLEVYDLMTGKWTSIDTPDWVAEGARWQIESAAAGLGGEPPAADAATIWVPEVLGEEDGPGTVYRPSGQGLRTDWIAHYDLWEAAGAEPYGPQALDPLGIHLSGFGPATAQQMFPTVELVDPDGARVMGADVVVTRDQSFSNLSVLVLPFGGADGARWNACCPVVGWLGGPETVLLESHGNEWRVLGWDVGTRRLWRVTEVVGWVPGQDSVVGRWAALGPR